MLYMSCAVSRYIFIIVVNKTRRGAVHGALLRRLWPHLVWSRPWRWPLHEYSQVIAEPPITHPNQFKLIETIVILSLTKWSQQSIFDHIQCGRDLDLWPWKPFQFCPDLEFSRLESWSRDVSRPVFTSLGLGLEPRSLVLGLGLGTLQSPSRSWDLRQWSK